MIKSGKMTAILLAAFMGVSYSSCCGDSDGVIDAPAAEAIETTISIGGEYVEVTEEPLGRAGAPHRYFGINIYRQKSDGTDNLTPFAYGVFDASSNIKIKLLPGYLYTFECSIVVDDLDVLAKVKTDGTGHFMHPFELETVGSSGSGAATYYPIAGLNMFCTSPTVNLSGLKYGKSTVVDADSGIDSEGYADSHTDYLYPRLMRYYGEADGFEPSTGGVVTLDMKTVAFGLRIVVNGLVDGHLTWADAYGNLQFDKEGMVPGGDNESVSTFTMYDIADWLADPSNNNCYTGKIAFTWKRESNLVDTFDTKTIDFKRNVRTVLKVDLDDGAKDVGFKISYEGVMEEEEIPVSNPKQS